MALTKYASFEAAQVLDIKGANQRVREASLDKIGDYSDFRTQDGYLYARIRAISSRVNKNHDGWPSVELAGGSEVFDKRTSSEGFTVEANSSDEFGFSTFLGKPIFVDHHNSDPERARGAIVDAKLHVDDHKTASLDPYYASDDCDPEHKPSTWVELLLEVDAKTFPRLAKAIVAGSKNSEKGIDGFSMGCDVEKSICNICKNSATSPEEYCDHVRMKGASFKHEGKIKKSYENCYGVKFFEISAVFDPADETALIREVKSSVNKEATIKVAQNPLPQADLLHAPPDIDTLREEQVCPVCGSSMEEDECDVCGYTAPPEGFDNPDLSKKDEGTPEEQNAPDEAFQNLPDGALGPDQAAQPPEKDTSNPLTVAHVKNDTWSESLPARLAGPSDEPDEEVLEDSDKPITSSVRTAGDFIAAAGAQRRTTKMNHHTADAASGAPEVASPDTNTDVVGVGGIVDASNEEASKADTQTNVEGVGGTGEDSVSAESTESLPNNVTDESSGFDKKKDIEKIPTKTFDDGSSGVERQADPVSGEPFPRSEDGVKASAWVIESHDDGVFPTELPRVGDEGASAEQGVQPVDPIGVAQDRVNVLEHVTSPGNNSGPTTTWTGTDGNGVLHQQDPTTGETLEGSDGVKSAHIFAAFKLADLEVDLGLISAEKKYERVAGLEHASSESLQAQLAYAQRVKTSGMSRPARTASRVPVLGRNASAVEASSSDETVYPDEALFS